jgi:FixJ family two-component response regulator
MKVAVIDDEKSSAEALARLLRSGGLDSIVFSSAEAFLCDPAREAVDCAVVDILMPEIDGLRLQETLAQSSPYLSIVFVTGHGTVPMTVRAMQSGAVDVLEKPVNDESLLKAVRRAAERTNLLRASLLAHQDLECRLRRLTLRERQVFSLVTAGLLNKQIGYELGTTEKTVKVQRARVMEKMEAESFADLVRIAQDLGVVPNGSTSGTKPSRFPESLRHLKMTKLAGAPN